MSEELVKPEWWDRVKDLQNSGDWRALLSAWEIVAKTPRTPAEQRWIDQEVAFERARGLI